jgi:hypothetical protein
LTKILMRLGFCCRELKKKLKFLLIRSRIRKVSRLHRNRSTAGIRSCKSQPRSKRSCFQQSSKSWWTWTLNIFPRTI